MTQKIGQQFNERMICIVLVVDNTDFMSYSSLNLLFAATKARQQSEFKQRWNGFGNISSDLTRDASGFIQDKLTAYFLASGAK